MDAMQDDHISTSRVVPLRSDRSQKATTGTEKSGLYAIQAESVETQFTQWTELSAFNPLAMARRFETLETRTKRKGKEEEPDKAEKKEQVQEVQRLEEVADQFEQKNPELAARTLLLLRARASGKETKESLLQKVLDIYPDHALADEALDFLIQSGDAELIKTAREVKAEINTIYAREIKAGRNIALQAREFSAQGLGSPTALRDIYRDITGNPRDALTLFDQLSTTFSYDKMKTVIDFVLHSLGADLKSKGPSISPGELHRLFSETRDMQAILGVFRFFKSRMNLILSAFQRGSLPFPNRVNFESLARLFMKYLQERYPSTDKALQMAIQLGLSDEDEGPVIVLTQMRDAVRQVAPKLYRSPQHRQDVLMSLIEALEDLEEEDEKEEDKDEKKRKGQG
ncbi:MAG: type III secretion system gatekeeper subunit SctW [Chlamydiales bacterium]|nr:type III secretion system gatekeeper subunit SctW [Chlamydiales bacterium]